MEKYHYGSTSGMVTLTATGLGHSNFTNDGTKFNDVAMTSRSVLSLHHLSTQNKQILFQELGINFFILTDREGHSNFVCSTLYVR
jgi:hypothetical protein